MQNIPPHLPQPTQPIAPPAHHEEETTRPALPAAALRSATRSHPDLARMEALIHEHRIKAALARSASSGRIPSAPSFSYSTRSGLSRNSSSASLTSEVEPMRWFSKGGDTPLHLACHRNQPEQVKTLLAGADAAQINQPNALGQTPLHFAAKRKNLEVIELLLAHGANPLAEDRGHSTPLWFSVINGHADGIRTLLEAIPDPATRSHHAARCLDYAQRYQTEDIIALLKHAAT